MEFISIIWTLVKIAGIIGIVMIFKIWFDRLEILKKRGQLWKK